MLHLSVRGCLAADQNLLVTAAAAAAPSRRWLSGTPARERKRTIKPWWTLEVVQVPDVYKGRDPPSPKRWRLLKHRIDNSTGPSRNSDQGRDQPIPGRRQQPQKHPISHIDVDNSTGPSKNIDRVIDQPSLGWQQLEKYCTDNSTGPSKKSDQGRDQPSPGGQQPQKHPISHIDVENSTGPNKNIDRVIDQPSLGWQQLEKYCTDNSTGPSKNSDQGRDQPSPGGQQLQKHPVSHADVNDSADTSKYGDQSRDRPSPRSQQPQTPESIPTPMPRLSQQQLEKISSKKQIWYARSLYFVSPTRQQQQPEHRAAQDRQILHATDNTRGGGSSVMPDGGTIVADAARDLAHAQATKFFLTPPAKFLYSAFRLENHPVNTTTPEICFIGASNCGKSSFINALTGSPSGSFASLAREGARAGKTRAMNTYGVGPLTAAQYHRHPQGGKTTTMMMRSAPVSPQAAQEPGRQHGVILVDTPGYGFASHKEWGHEIERYLAKRPMLRGVVLLLSAEKERLTHADLQITRLLADSGRPVLVVLTKMDKIFWQGSRETREAGFAERMGHLDAHLDATLGNGDWDGKVYLTAANMAKEPGPMGSDVTRSSGGIAGVRMAVLEMAGVREFVAPSWTDTAAAAAAAGTQQQLGGEAGGKKDKDKDAAAAAAAAAADGSARQEPGRALESDPAAWSGDVISFEELESRFGDWSK